MNILCLPIDFSLNKDYIRANLKIRKEENMMKLFYLIGGLLGFLVVWLGIIGPFCISAASTPLVIGWIVATLLIAPYIYKLGKKAYKEIENLV